jgi:hypothetical protein
MYKEWLSKRITVAEAEAANLVRDDPLGAEPVAFGFMNDRWCALLAQMQDGDELWEFCSPSESWQRLAGTAGVALVRNGEVVDSIVTLLN